MYYGSLVNTRSLKYYTLKPDLFRYLGNLQRLFFSYSWLCHNMPESCATHTSCPVVIFYHFNNLITEIVVWFWLVGWFWLVFFFSLFWALLTYRFFSKIRETGHLQRQGTHTVSAAPLAWRCRSGPHASQEPHLSAAAGTASQRGRGRLPNPGSEQTSGGKGMFQR